MNSNEKKEPVTIQDWSTLYDKYPYIFYLFPDLSTSVLLDDTLMILGSTDVMEPKEDFFFLQKVLAGMLVLEGKEVSRIKEVIFIDCVRDGLPEGAGRNGRLDKNLGIFAFSGRDTDGKRIDGRWQARLWYVDFSREAKEGPLGEMIREYYTALDAFDLEGMQHKISHMLPEDESDAWDRLQAFLDSTDFCQGDDGKVNVFVTAHTACHTKEELLSTLTSHIMKYMQSHAWDKKPDSIQVAVLNDFDIFDTDQACTQFKTVIACSKDGEEIIQAPQLEIHMFNNEYRGKDESLEAMRRLMDFDDDRAEAVIH